MGDDLSNVILVIFAMCAALDIAASIKKDIKYKRIFKPVLMPLLICFYVLSVGEAANIAVIAALAFGCLGDSFLLGKSEKCFTLGLGSFLAGHICYIIALVPRIGIENFFSVVLVLMASVAAYIVYACVICGHLLPSVDKQTKPAVMAYIVVILAMSFIAELVCISEPGLNTVLTLIGSFFFIVSDSVLAFEEFKGESGKAVMPTYVAAQLLIVLGFVITG